MGSAGVAIALDWRTYVHSESFGIQLATSNYPLGGIKAIRLCVQIPQLVINGGRPEIPSRPNLPGPDTASFASLDAYLDLMR